MRKITQEEKQSLSFYTVGKSGSSLTSHNSSAVKSIVDMILSLDVEESFILEKEEWKLKTNPSQRLRNILPNVKISVNRLTDDSGWVITRL